MSTAPHSDASPTDSSRQAFGVSLPSWHPRTLGRLGLGLAVILDCFFAGEFIKARCGLIIPASVLGLFLLLALLGFRIVPLTWVEDASRLLLFLLPAAFVPIYVLAAENHALWREWGLIIVGTLSFCVVALWWFAGWLARRVFGAEGRAS
ncbi:MAG TPA: CidA/LrgA family protein [Candidatus Didemnitutus sp.]|nr:CidA/LrgA family protein [Candidatus Didemnitutus sp.]